MDKKRIKVPVVKAANLFFLLFLLSGMVIWGIISLFYKIQFKSIESSLTTQEVYAVNLQKIEIEDSLSDIVSDLLFLSMQNELQEYFRLGEEHARISIEKEYSQLSLRKKKYDQIRYLDSTGQEIVRINYNNGHPATVDKDQLQNKLHRYYFSDAFKLKKGEVFISPLDLNIEHGEIEQPLKPMLRLGTPVFDKNGEKCGVVLINYLAQKFLSLLRENSQISKGHSMLLNRDGYWLLHSDPGKEWGFMFKEREKLSFANFYPEEWQTILKQKRGQLHTDRGLFTFTTVYPLQKGFSTPTSGQTYTQDNQHTGSTQYCWILISYLSPKELKSYITPLQFRVFFLGLGLLVLVALGVWFLAFSITKRRIYEEHLLTMAFHDALTLLPNRKFFFNKLEEGISHAKRYEKQLALLYIDLDGFKIINDTLGHEAGDELLIKVSQRMLAVTRKTDTVARLGGDEFAVILFQVDSQQGALASGEKLIQQINKPIELHAGIATVGASIGIAIYPDVTQHSEDLVKLADQAMYVSKSKGKNICTLSQGREKETNSFSYES